MEPPLAEASPTTQRPAASPLHAARVTPQDNPELFTGGLWPVLQRPHQSIFDGRESPRLELDEATDRVRTDLTASEWYDRHMQRHRCLQQHVRATERLGQVTGLLYGMVAFVLSLSIGYSSFPLPPTVEARIRRHEGDGSDELIWDEQERLFVGESFEGGIIVGTAAHAALLFVIFLLVTIGVGVGGASDGSVAPLSVLTVLLFVLLLALSCFNGHKKKRMKYLKLLAQEAPAHIPSLLQLEIAERNAKVLRKLQGAANGASRPTSAVERAREERSMMKDVEQLRNQKSSVRQSWQSADIRHLGSPLEEGGISTPNDSFLQQGPASPDKILDHSAIVASIGEREEGVAWGPEDEGQSPPLENVSTVPGFT